MMKRKVDSELHESDDHKNNLNEMKGEKKPKLQTHLESLQEEEEGEGVDDVDVEPAEPTEDDFQWMAELNPVEMPIDEDAPTELTKRMCEECEFT